MRNKKTFLGNVCNDHTKIIGCENGVISVTSAWYGRKDSSTTNTCDQTVVEDDCGVDVKLNVTFLCENFRICHLTASNELFGRNSTCSRGTPQNLQVKHACKPYGKFYLALLGQKRWKLYKGTSYGCSNRLILCEQSSDILSQKSL